MTKNINIPRKSLFKLDEVCSLTGVKPYVLRFWESEFDQISPLVSSSGQKLFEHKDIEAVLEIKELLFEQKMTIEKAKMIMDKEEEIIEDINTQEAVIEQALTPEAQVQADGAPQVPQQMNEDYLEELDEAKVLLKDLVARTEAIKTHHNWI